MADTLEQLLSQVNSFRAGADTATQQVLAALDAQNQINNSTVNTYKQQATDDATVAAAKLAADYKTQLARVKGANSVGANLNDSSEVITGLAAAAADAQKRKDEALAAIQQKDSVSFLDSPIQYILNQFTINDDIAKHNIANQQLESAHNRIMEVNAEAQQTAATQNAINEPLTAASMEAATRNAAVQATVNANNARIQGLQYGVQGIQFALGAKKEALEALFQAKQAQNSEQSLSLQQQGLELQQKSFEQQQYEFNLRRQDKQEQDKIGQSVIDTINLGRKALLGPNAEPLDDISGKLALGALKSKGELSDELKKYYDAGERARLTGKASYGSTPAQAADTLKTVPAQINPTQNAVKGILEQAARDTNDALKTADVPGMNKNPAFAGMDKKNKDSINAAYNARSQQILNDAAKVIKPGDNDNPYQISSINNLAAKSPTIQSLPVYQKVLKPLVDAGVQLTDPKQIMSAVSDAVAKGTITHKEALDISTIYHVGVAANMAMRNFEGFGLKPSWSYNAKVTTDPGAWGSDEIIDLTKPDDISRAILKSQASRIRSNLIKVGSNSLSTGRVTDQTQYQFDPSKLQFGPETHYPSDKDR